MGMRINIGHLKLGSGSSAQSWSSYWASHLFGISDLVARYTSRNGSSLVDSLGGASLPILLSHFHNPSATTHILYYADNGALDIGSGDLTASVWLEDLTSADTTMCIIGKWMDGTAVAGSWMMYISSATGKLYAWIKTSNTFYSVATTNKARTYGKCWAAMKVDNTNKVLQLYLNNVQVGSDVSFSGTFSAMDNKYKTCVGMSNNNAGNSFVYKFFGNLSDARIDKRLLSTAEMTTLYNRGIVTGADALWPLYQLYNESTSALVFPDVSGNARHLTQTSITNSFMDKSTFGSQHALNAGYDIWTTTGYRPFHLPHALDGSSVYNTYSGYSRYGIIAGNSSKHNGYRSFIQFSNSFFDRSDVTIYNDNARRTNAIPDIFDGYDVTNPKLWFISELTNEFFEEVYTDAYNGRLFSAGGNNPYDIDKDLRELIFYNNQKSGNDLKKVRAFIKRPYNIGGICISFSDISRIDSWNAYDSNVLKLKYGLKATLFINAASQAILTAQNAKILRLRNRNYEIANHSVNHSTEATIEATYGLNYTNIYNGEVAPLQGWLNTLLGNLPVSFGYFNDFIGGTTFDNICFANGFVTVRPDGPAETAFYKGESQRTQGVSETIFNPFAEGDPDAIYPFLEEARSQNKIFILECHTIAEADGDTTISISRLEAVLQYCIDNNMRFYTHSKLLPGLFT